jgi:hypothetical protein
MGRRITLYEAALAESEATDLESARQAAIAAFAKADSVFRLIHRIREYGAPTFGFVGLLVVVAILLAWGFNGFTRDYWDAEPPSTAMVRVTIFFGLALACYSVWDIALLFEKFGLVPGRLKAPALAPFHLIRERCAGAATAAFEHDGKVIDGPIFKSCWSLILFSQYPAHRRFQLPNANGIIEGQSLIDAPISGEVIVFDPGIEPAHEAPVINAVINHSSTTNTLNVQNTFHPPTEPKRRTIAEKPHWYSSVSFAMHSERSVKIANHWNGGETGQVRTALDTAFARTREGKFPNIARGDLVDEIVEALKAANLKAGLGKTNSKEWITKMFGEGERHDYTWVRRYLTEKDFEPPYELPFSQ